ncbi:MAG: RNA polymerase sigma factor [Sphingobacterium sp.]
MKTILDRIIIENQGTLTRLAAKFTKDPSEKEDLVQETFIRSLKSLESFDNHPKLIPWLFVIMKNIYFNRFRRTTIQRRVEKEIEAEHLTKRSAKNGAELKFVHEDIDRAIGELSEENYTIITMYLEGYKYQEIGDYLEIKEGTIKTRIHSIRKKLRSKLHIYTPAGGQ